MKYDRLSGTFGVFDGRVTFRDGLNVICAGNESGKSTACALIRAILYGISTSEREKKGVIPDKTKYLPWSGKPMYGRLELTFNGRQITLTRETTRGGPMRGFSAVYSDTNEPVAFLSASDAGEALTGVTQEVFTRSAFCSAESLAVTENGELERKIEAIAGTGDESVSASAADAVLGKWLRERKFNNTGKIPDTEREIRELSAQIGEVEKINAEMSRVQNEKEAFEARRGAISERLRRADILDAAKKLERTAEIKRQLDEDTEAEAALVASENLTGNRADRAYAEEALRVFKAADVRGIELDNAKADYLRAQANAKAYALPPELSVFEGLEPDFALDEVKKDCDESRRLLLSRPRFWIFGLALFFAAGGTGLLFVELADRLMRNVFSGMCYCLCAAAAVWAVLDILKASKRRKQGEAIYRRYGADSPEGIITCAAKYSGFFSEYKLRNDVLAEKKKALDSAEISLALAKKSADEYERGLEIPEGENPIKAAERLLEALAERDKLQKRIVPARAALSAFEEAYDLEALKKSAAEAESLGEGGVFDPETEKTALSGVENEIRQKEMEYERLRGRLSRYDDLAAMRGRLEALNEQKDAMTAEYLAISAAREALSRSSEELSRRLTPALAGRAEQIFSLLTGKKYEKLSLTKDFDAEVTASGEVAARKLLSLSRGAYDQLYLAVRIALSEVIYQGELPPLVLDDVTASFDDERMRETLEFLAEESEKRQIILFTCREREIAAGEKLGANIITKLY